MEVFGPLWLIPLIKPIYVGTLAGCTQMYSFDNYLANILGNTSAIFWAKGVNKVGTNWLNVVIESHFNR